MLEKCFYAYPYAILKKHNILIQSLFYDVLKNHTVSSQKLAHN